MTTTIEAINQRAEIYAKVHALLTEKVTALTAAQDALKREHLPGIKAGVRRAADAEDALRALVAEHPECFIRPKTRVLAGVKVGYQKGKGTLDYDDADAVVARIEKHLPEQADVLIRLKKTPVKDALAQLPAADLRKLGITLAEAGDQVVIKPADSEVDKLVEALLKGAQEEVAS
jgi:hypothetical protein